eukprot:CAMPEP_0206590790 /NCGR_PEP_ID=MMETSP0325_2-20121206/39846_1 /ASSEMBLY_ACC=CAM_ASM_000347 /TAXON_ID=2866 /ORGANISM="Crypthecodinium cohnii, Strain Seligo" /LENGTH=76 /DNA_ID=CAMNT_0054099843 /DNA_START=11 /DNA_END=238 /DNA_ORIENTATION=-
MVGTTSAAAMFPARLTPMAVAASEARVVAVLAQPLLLELVPALVVVVVVVVQAAVALQALRLPDIPAMRIVGLQLP